MTSESYIMIHSLLRFKPILKERESATDFLAGIFRNPDISKVVNNLLLKNNFQSIRVLCVYIMKYYFNINPSCFIVVVIHL